MCVRACVCVCVRACVRVCVCVKECGVAGEGRGGDEEDITRSHKRNKAEERKTNSQS